MDRIKEGGSGQFIIEISINHIDEKNIGDIDPIEEILKEKSITIKDSYKESLAEIALLIKT